MKTWEQNFSAALGLLALQGISLYLMYETGELFFAWLDMGIAFFVLYFLVSAVLSLWNSPEEE